MHCPDDSMAVEDSGAMSPLGNGDTRALAPGRSWEAEKLTNPATRTAALSLTCLTLLDFELLAGLRCDLVIAYTV